MTTITLDLTRSGAMQRIEWLAWFTDSSIAIPGTSRSFGADALLSLIPGIGSLAGAGISLYIVAEALLHRAPAPMLARMGGNILLDALIGAIPVLGFFFDLAFKANQRNLNLLRAHVKGDQS